jgi:hypothetical protein
VTAGGAAKRGSQAYLGPRALAAPGDMMIDRVSPPAGDAAAQSFQAVCEAPTAASVSQVLAPYVCMCARRASRGSAAIWAGGKPRSDSSTITARAACRHRPRRPASNCSISLPGPLANTLTGRVVITTSPAGRTMWATSIQPPARLMSTPLGRRSHSGLRAELMDRRLAGVRVGCRDRRRVAYGGSSLTGQQETR